MTDPIAAMLGAWALELNIYTVILRLALIPQAGVAIGLAAMGARTLGGDAGSALETIILASSILYELVGPACAKLSLYLSGSISDKIEDLAPVDTFDANGVQKIASGSGLPEGIIPAMSDAEDENPGTGTDTPTQPENPGQTPETGDNAIIYMLVLIAATTIGFVTVSSKRRSVR